MKRDFISLAALMIFTLLSIFSPVAANQDSSVNVKRAACTHVSGQCRSPYTFSDVAEYVKVFETHTNATPSQAYINTNLQLGPSDLKRRDILHFNSEGDLFEIWSRYHRKIADIGVQSKRSYPVHANGAIASINLTSSQFINNKFYPHQTTLSFDNSGKVIEDDFYPTTPLSKHDNEYFINVSHRVADAFDLAELTVSRGSQITVDTQGKIRSVVLSLGHWYAGRYYPSNTKLVVDDENRVKISDLYLSLNQNGENRTRVQTGVQLLIEPSTLGKLTLPAGTLVEKNLGHYTAAHLLEKTNVCGFTKQGESIVLQGYTNGSYSFSMNFDQDVMTQGYKLRHNKKNVEFHDNCTLKKATLSTAKTVKSFPLAANSEFELDRNGQLMAGTLGESYSINTISLSAGTSFSFNPRYSVGLMLFRGGVVTDGDREYESSFMQIYKHGVIAWGQLNKPVEIDGKVYEKGTQLKFTPKGKLISADLR